MENSMRYISDLMSFMDNSVVNFYAVKTIRERLDANSFKVLDAADKWELTPGGKYYVVKNNSAIFGFVVGKGDVAAGYKIISAHSDSPCFRIKPNPESVLEEFASSYVKIKQIFIRRKNFEF